MFGFLYSPSPSCGTQVRSYYQGLFCGLSCQLHKDFGPLSRFLVNRDSTFLSLVGDSIALTPSSVTERTCCNPLAKKRPITCNSTSLEFSSAVTMCALAVKLDDNIQDDSGFKKAISKFGSAAITRSKDRAVATLNSIQFPTSSVMAAMKSQKEIESKQPNLEEAAEPTAFAFGSIMNHQATLHSQDQLGSQLCELGRSLGRLIYWRDAIDDYNDDIASNSFNPLRYSSRESLTELTKIEFTKLTSLTSNIPWLRNRESIISILDHSALHHADMMSSTSSATRRKKKKSNGKWYENCDCFCGDCCSCPTRSGGSVSCCDLGDCGCCPCDGCSC